MKDKNMKGFTLIELLAVIVILGLLMAIAIPSVTKYITESRKKTVTTTLGNYIGSLVNEVNDLSYTFTGTNTIYAVPIECISLERGGINPFGEWMQANDDYFAYVLIQYDDENSKYVYGFTFKDSAGYGLYPTVQSKIKENGSQIKTKLDLNNPKTGEITSLTTLEKWQESGFKVDSTTNLQVLIAESEGVIGNGKTTCTLCQKAKNYATVEEAKIKPVKINMLDDGDYQTFQYTEGMTWGEWVNSKYNTTNAEIRDDDSQYDGMILIPLGNKNSGYLQYKIPGQCSKHVYETDLVQGLDFDYIFEWNLECEF